MRLVTGVLAALFAVTAAAAEPLPAALAAYAGRPVVLDFWASWCGPCAQSFPWLNQMQARYGADLAIVGVNVDANAPDADRFLRSHPASFAIVRDPAGALAEKYAIEGMPATVILGADGTVQHRHTGFLPDKTAAYEAALRAALPRKDSP